LNIFSQRNRNNCHFWEKGRRAKVENEILWCSSK